MITSHLVAHLLLFFYFTLLECSLLPFIMDEKQLYLVKTIFNSTVANIDTPEQIPYICAQTAYSYCDLKYHLEITVEILFFIF